MEFKGTKTSVEKDAQSIHGPNPSSPISFAKEHSTVCTDV